jgi:hypothetical protein
MPAQSDEETYEIERILSYDPSKGYLVVWKGFPESESSWQIARQMPPAFKEEMRSIRQMYEDNGRGSTGKQSRSFTENSRKPFGAVALNSQATPEPDDDLWFIDEVLEYDPKKGYLVSWNGCDQSLNSWQAPNDMPSGCRLQMKFARENYKRSLRKRTVRKKPKTTSPKQKQKKKLIKRFRALALDQKTADAPAENQIPTKTRRAKDIIKSINKFQQKQATREVHSILQFDPSKGYLVHWKQTRPSEDSWLPESDIGIEFEEQKRLASERYCDSLI